MSFNDRMQIAQQPLVNLRVAHEEEIADLNRIVGKYREDQIKLQDELDALKSTPRLVPARNLADIHLHNNWRIGVSPGLKPGDPGFIAPMNTSLVQGTDYGYKQNQKLGGSDSAMVLSFNKAPAGEYNGFLAGLHRPIERRAGKLVWRGAFWLSAAAKSGMQALEFDTRFVIDKLNYNLSCEWNQAKGGLLQVVDDINGKGWKDTDIKFDLPTEAWVPWEWEYWFDHAAEQFGYAALTVAGKRYPITSLRFNVESPGQIEWADGFHCQLQIGTNNKGIPFGVGFDNLGYNWKE